MSKLDEKVAELKPENIDDLIKNIQQLGENFDRIRERYHLDQELGTIMLKADDPDARMKVNEIIKMVSLVDQLKASVLYLNTPVKLEGMLQWKLDGTVKLNDITINEGTKLEYLAADQWNIGFLRRSKETGSFGIFDDRGNVVISKIEQIPARIR